MISETSNNVGDSGEDNEPVQIPVEDASSDAQMNDELSKRLRDLEAQLGKERQKAMDYLNRLKYLQADIDNLQKKTKRDIESYRELANEKLLLKMLGVKEDLERAQESAPKESPPQLMEGINMILGKLKNIFREEGLQEIESIGRKFDPSYHEVVSFSSRDDVEDGIVLSEIRKGYTLNGKVIRTSMVEVARKPEAKNQALTDAKDEKQQQQQEEVKGAESKGE
jgi:molecular chaperone GrpE